MYLCGPGKHNCQPFCGPEGRFYCSDSVCSLWPAPFSYLCVSVMILCVCWKLSAAEQVKTDCRLRLLWSPLYWLRCLCLVLWPLRTITHVTQKGSKEHIVCKFLCHATDVFTYLIVTVGKFLSNLIGESPKTLFIFQSIHFSWSISR